MDMHQTAGDGAGAHSTMTATRVCFCTRMGAASTVSPAAPAAMPLPLLPGWKVSAMRPQRGYLCRLSTSRSTWTIPVTGNGGNVRKVTAAGRSLWRGQQIPGCGCLCTGSFYVRLCGCREGPILTRHCKNYPLWNTGLSA